MRLTNKDITIVSAAWNCTQFIKSNWKSMSHYNTKDLKWLIVNNTPAKKLEELEGIENFTIINGISQKYVKVPKKNRAIHVGSWHHAAGLNKSLEHINTRYALFLDPDFYISPPLETIINHMNDNGLAFFGTPYAIDGSTRPSSTFPCVYCLFVDTKMVDMSKFDFTPQPTDLYKGDTGTKVYLDHLDFPYESVSQSVADKNVRRILKEHPEREYNFTESTMQNTYQLEPPSQAKNIYFWKDCLFGIHVRMKIKSRGEDGYSPKGIQQRHEKEKLKEIQNLISIGRSHLPSPDRKLFKVFMSDEAPRKVSEVLWSGQLAQGPENKVFEKTLSSHFSSKNIVTVNSCTSAIHLAIDLVKQKEKLTKKDIAICSPLTCAAGIFPFVHNDISIKWCDISKDTLNIDLDKLEGMLTEKTRIVSFVHWGGYPIDYKKLNSIKRRYAGKYNKNLYVIEDCAHAWGSTWHGNLVGGNIIDFSCFSFQAIKSLTTGDGGLLITPPEFTAKARRKRWFGLDRDNNVTFRSGLPIKDAGYKFHMNDIASAIGLCNYPYIEENIEAQRQNAAVYYQELSGMKNVRLLENDPRNKSSYWLFTILANRRNELIEFLKEDHIESSPVHARNDKHAALVKYDKQNLPVMDEVTEKMLCIPVGWWLSIHQIRDIAKTIRGFYGE
tara:strand:+ start:5481 stop:7484 length:2004 start_codon:yes stop_codon:yes gene_type:complete